MLHEGSGAAAVNAFVEIVFDNSDNRFSLESDEVVIRRTVGHKKDEFFLQRKRANKNEIMSLLEGAGFSKSNPYFIVQQGKVNALCTMSDGERLQLLKEVAGTTVYDEKKKESLVKMEENNSSIEKITETLQYMEERLEELRGEKEELTQYQSLDKQRRALEYTLYDKELKRARETLDDIEHARAEEMETRGLILEEGRATEESIATVESQMKSHTNLLRRHKKIVAELEQDNTAAMTLKSQLEVQCREMQEAISTEEIQLKKNALELQTLEQKIKTAKSQLEQKVNPDLETKQQQVKELTKQRQDAETRMDVILAKQGRGRQFRTKSERDRHLKTLIKDLAEASQTTQQQLDTKTAALQKVTENLQSSKEELETKSNDMKQKVQLLETLSEQISSQKKARNEMAEIRKEQWRELEDMKEQRMDARETCQKALSNLRKLMPRATASGLDALTYIVEREKIKIGEQYFGWLMQNLEVTDEKFQTAVEVAAQNSLFHVVVDTDETAARLMGHLERERLGRVTFLPLNQLRVDDHIRYPDSSDVTPIIKRCIRYDPKVHRAMHHVFGRKLLARSTDVASTWSTQSSMDAITLDGDLCSRNGALTGGYVNINQSRLRAHAEVHASEDAYRKIDASFQQLSNKNKSFDTQVSQVMADIQKLEAKHAKLDRVLHRTEEDLTKLSANIEKYEQQSTTLSKETIPPLQAELERLDKQNESLRQEMGTE